MLRHCLITGARRRDHVRPVLPQLHWLPVHRVRQRVAFNRACFMHKSLSSRASCTWLTTFSCCLNSEGDRHQRRLSATRTCVVPSHSLHAHNSYGDSGGEPPRGFSATQSKGKSKESRTILLDLVSTDYSQGRSTHIIPAGSSPAPQAARSHIRNVEAVQAHCTSRQQSPLRKQPPTGIHVTPMKSPR